MVAHTHASRHARTLAPPLTFARTTSTLACSPRENKECSKAIYEVVNLAKVYPTKAVVDVTQFHVLLTQRVS